MEQQNIVIYTIPTCSDCHDAKRFFQESGVTYLEKDCTTDANYPQEVFDLTGKQVVPTIVLEDQVFIGFSNNYEKIVSILKN
ncbi:glutaredoxin family protein [Shimazuella kribbensis]|uniref:glutaredoxin family protein n=1 Tax=Shimazuella kribbensis TaxID=139808 RepID=UPI000429B411|nr:glutaredoxin family protein [Shimazuella kribbensis]